MNAVTGTPTLYAKYQRRAEHAFAQRDCQRVTDTDPLSGINAALNQLDANNVRALDWQAHGLGMEARHE